MYMFMSNKNKYYDNLIVKVFILKYVDGIFIETEERVHDTQIREKYLHKSIIRQELSVLKDLDTGCLNSRSSHK